MNGYISVGVGLFAKACRWRRGVGRLERTAALQWQSHPMYREGYCTKGYPSGYITYYGWIPKLDESRQDDSGNVK